MSALSLRLPESLHKAAKVLAKKEHISINQLVTLALAEKMAALEAEDYLSKRAKRGNRADYLRILKKSPNVPPEDKDKL
jgi:HicB-like protein involved in pilus formation